MNFMTRRHIAKRALLTAVITATTSVASGSVYGAEKTIVQAGYQPGQQASGNTTVTQELNRMFEESGRPMPSMLQQDLPNANRPIQNHAQSHTVQPQPQFVPSPPQQSSPSFLSKLFGKFRGKSSASNPNVQPPVPPDYVPAKPGAVAANPARPQSMTQPNRPAHAAAQGPVTQNQNVRNQSQPVAPTQNNFRSDTAQAYYGNRPIGNSSQQPSADFQNGVMSPIPPRSGATVQPYPFVSSTASERDAAYSQPGSAPGFMTKNGSAAVLPTQPVPAVPTSDRYRQDFVKENSASFGNSAIEVKSPAPVPVPGAVARKPADGFSSPFVDSPDSGDSSEMLDLDSLIDIPPAAPEEIKSVADKTEDVAESLVSKPAAKIKSVETAALPTESTFDQPKTMPSTPAQSPAEENPFTGIHLDTTDAEFFGTAEPAPMADGNSLEIPVMPVEEFDPNLPAIELPAIDEFDADTIAAGTSPESDELRKTPVNDSAAPSAAAPSAAARAELPNANVPATLNAADTERLRQTAEQERRSNQLRLIQSRAGQSGFKGFCPVALRERRELVNANPLFTSTFGLQTYTFSSAEAKAAFDTDPSRYAPAAGGSDVVVLVNSGEEQAGQLDYALWYRDRLYLFRSRETMTLFSSDPQRFSSQY